MVELRDDKEQEISAEEKISGVCAKFRAAAGFANYRGGLSLPGLTLSVSYGE